MQLVYLQSFYEVGKCGSFTKAAESLNISKGVLSRHVKLLETELAALLFYRTTRSVTLTEAGQSLFVKCQQIFYLTLEAQKDIADLTQESTGNLRFSCSISLGEKIAQQVVPQFHQQMPSVNLELNLDNKNYDMINGEQDISLRATNNLEDDIVAKYLGRIRDVVVASPDFLAKHQAITHPQQLSSMPCLLNNHRAKWNQWVFSKDDHEESVLVSGNISANQYITARTLALQGQAIAKVPYYLVEHDIKQNKIKTVLDNYQTSTHHLYIVHAQHVQLPKKIQCFKALLLEWKKNNPECFLD